jgi:hypothetical protein
VEVDQVNRRTFLSRLAAGAACLIPWRPKRSIGVDLAHGQDVCATSVIIGADKSGRGGSVVHLDGSGWRFVVAGGEIYAVDGRRAVVIGTDGVCRPWRL